MPVHGIVPKRAASLQADIRDALPHEAPHTQDDARLALDSQFKAILGAVRDALSVERFAGIIAAPTAIILRDAPIVLQTLHNPTAAAVTVTLLIDAGANTPWVSLTLAAGATLVNLNLQFPRLSGYVSSGYVTFGGELPAS
jgi:hypothetical protein